MRLRRPPQCEGRPEIAELIPLASLKISLSKTAYAHTDKHLEPHEEIENNGGEPVEPASGRDRLTPTSTLH